MSVLNSKRKSLLASAFLVILSQTAKTTSNAQTQNVFVTSGGSSYLSPVPSLNTHRAERKAQSPLD